MRLFTLVALVLLALAACGDGNGSGAESDGGSQSTGGGQNGEGGQNGGGGRNGGGRQNGGGGDGDGGATDTSEDTLTTELDLGQAFAEDPFFQGELGPIEVTAIARRDTESTQVPVEFRVTNPSTTRLEDVSTVIAFQVRAGTDPEDPPVPSEGAPPLQMSPQTTVGQCSEASATPSQTAVRCDMGTLEGGAEALITVVSPDWFRLSVIVTVTASQ